MAEGIRFQINPFIPDGETWLFQDDGIGFVRDEHALDIIWRAVNGDGAAQLKVKIFTFRLGDICDPIVKPAILTISPPRLR